MKNVELYFNQGFIFVLYSITKAKSAKSFLKFYIFT